MKHYGPRYKQTKARFKNAFGAVEAMRQELYQTWSNLKADLRCSTTPAEIDAAIDRAERRVGDFLTE